MKTILSLCALTALSCGSKDPVWNHDITISIESHTTNEQVELVINAVEKIQPSFPYLISIVISDSIEDINFSIVNEERMQIELLNNHDYIKVLPAGLYRTSIDNVSNTIECGKVFILDTQIHQNTVSHEIIHTIGIIEHSKLITDIMYEQDQPFEMNYENDLNRIKDLYTNK